MSGFLIDTSSLSLLAPGRVNTAIADAIRRHSKALFLPTIAVCEIHAGIFKLRRQGAVRRADALDQWLGRLVEGFGSRVLDFDLAAAHHAGRLSDATLARGRHPGFADIAIAATARSRNLVVITENLRHLEPMEVEFIALNELA